jgi:hypothetical protein
MHGATVSAALLPELHAVSIDAWTVTNPGRR